MESLAIEHGRPHVQLMISCTTCGASHLQFQSAAKVITPTEMYFASL